MTRHVTAIRWVLAPLVLRETHGVASLELGFLIAEAPNLSLDLRL